MDKTNIMADFRIMGDDFNINDINSKLLLSPDYCWTKGEQIKIRPGFKREYTCWAISTGYEISNNVNNQLSKITSRLNNKSAVLEEMCNMLKLDYRFEVVINIENGEKPAIYLNKDIIQLASKIDAEIDIDLYIYS